MLPDKDRVQGRETWGPFNRTIFGLKMATYLKFILKFLTECKLLFKPKHFSPGFSVALTSPATKVPFTFGKICPMLAFRLSVLSFPPDKVLI